MRWLRWIAFILFLAALSGYQAYAIFVEQPDPSQHMPPAKDVHLSREVYGQCQLLQTFIVHADGFSELEVFPKKSAYPPQGRIGLRISDGKTTAYTALVSRVMDSSSLDLTRPLRIQVPRVDDSAGRLFMVEIWLPDAERGHGLRFEQGGPTYTDGNMLIDCLSDWGDLKFRARTQRTTIVDNLRPLRRSLPAWMPPWLLSDAALLGVLLLGNLALAMVVYSLAFAPANPTDHLPNGNVETTADQPRV